MYPIGWSLNAWEHWAVGQGQVWWNGNDECVALVETWVHNLKLSPILCQYAYQMFDSANPAQWEKIKNTPSFIGKAGDIIVFKEAFGSAGHACVVRNSLSTVNYLYTIDQNWSRPRHISYETHRYTPEHIIGALRKK